MNSSASSKQSGFDLGPHPIRALIGPVIVVAIVAAMTFQSKHGQPKPWHVLALVLDLVATTLLAHYSTKRVVADWQRCLVWPIFFVGGILASYICVSQWHVVGVSLGLLAIYFLGFVIRRIKAMCRGFAKYAWFSFAVFCALETMRFLLRFDPVIEDPLITGLALGFAVFLDDRKYESDSPQFEFPTDTDAKVAQ